MDLFPGVPRPLPEFEAIVTVPREPGGELVPASAPPGRSVMAAWTADQAVISVSVKAPPLRSSLDIQR